MAVWQPLAPLVGAALLAGGVDRAAGLSLRGVSWFAAVLAAAQVNSPHSLTPGGKVRDFSLQGKPSFLNQG